VISESRNYGQTKRRTNQVVCGVREVCDVREVSGAKAKASKGICTGPDVLALHG
jgi:hypothetical protein